VRGENLKLHPQKRTSYDKIPVYFTRYYEHTNNTVDEVFLGFPQSPQQNVISVTVRVQPNFFPKLHLSPFTRQPTNDAKYYVTLTVSQNQHRVSSTHTQRSVIKCESKSERHASSHFVTINSTLHILLEFETGCPHQIAFLGITI